MDPPETGITRSPTELGGHITSTFYQDTDCRSARNRRINASLTGSVSMPTCQEGCRLARNAFVFCSAHARKLRLCRTRSRTGIVRSMAICSTAAGQIPLLLHKTKTLVSQVLQPNSPGIPSTESSDFWENLLTSAYDDYQAGKRPARLVGQLSFLFADTRLTFPLVVGVDNWSRSEDLVTALLSDPLASDKTMNDAIRNRLLNHLNEKPLNISCVCPTFDD